MTLVLVGLYVIVSLFVFLTCWMYAIRNPSPKLEITWREMIFIVGSIFALPWFGVLGIYLAIWKQCIKRFGGKK